MTQKTSAFTKRFFSAFLAMVLSFILVVPVAYADSTSKSLTNAKKISVDETITLAVSGWNCSVEWESSDPGIATVTPQKGVFASKAVVKGIKPGTVKVTATATRVWDFWWQAHKVTSEFEITVKEQSYTVKFVTNGGTRVASQNVTQGQTVTRPEDPVKCGYVFNGWYEDSELLYEYDFSTPVNSDITLFAGWKKVSKPETIEKQIKVGEKVTLTYSANICAAVWISSDSDVAAVTSSSVGKKCEVTGIKAGTAFVTASPINIFSLIENKGTVIARYKIVVIEDEANENYTVTFESNGGSAVSSQNVKNGAAIVRPEDPIKEGFNFVGWYSDAALENEYDFASVVTSDITLYAKWSEVSEENNTFTVTFDSNGGSAVDSVKVAANNSVSAPQDPQKEGYRFIGWCKDSSLNTLYDFTYYVTNDMTLYACWSKETNGKVYTRGEWISMVAEIFSMNLNTDPDNIDYYYADTQNSRYGVAIETANAYGLLPPPDVDDLEQDVPLFKPNEIATREFAAYTVAKAMGFSNNYTLDTSNWLDWNDISYKPEAAVTVSNNIMRLENKCFNPKDALDENDILIIKRAVAQLNESVKLPNNEAYNNSEYLDSVIKDEVINVKDYIVVDNGNNTYTVTIAKNKINIEISENSVIVLPANEIYYSGFALKVTYVSSDDVNIILTGVAPKVEEVYSRIDIAGNAQLDASHVQPAEGVIFEYESPVRNNKTRAINPMADIDIGGSAALPGKLKFTIPKTSHQFNEYLEFDGVEVEITIPDITCILKGKVGILSGVHVDEITLSIEENIKSTVGFTYKLAESGYELTNSSGNTRWAAGRIELGRVPFPLVAGLSADIVFFLNVSSKGTASVTYTIDTTQGVQYKNGTMRSLCDFDDSLDLLEIKGSTKVGIGSAIDICAFNLMDLIGWSVEGGLGFDASFTLHALATDTLACGDVTLYGYLKNGLDKETAFGKFLDKVCHFTLEFENLKNDNKNPYKLKLHVENSKIVPECTFGTGGISGTVKALESKETIENARIEVYSGRNLIRRRFTSSDGKYNIDNLSAGGYIVTVSATGYFKYDIAVNVQKNNTTYIETALMVDRSGANQSSLVSGRITNAVTGNGITNTKYTLRENWNNTTGEVYSSGEFDSDSYSISLGVGYYTLSVSKDGYITNYVNISVSENACSNANVVLSPESSGIPGLEDNIRIVLTWGEKPADLDSHLFGPYTDNSSRRFHTFYSSKDFYENDTKSVNLDLDDTTSYGPETTTIYNIAQNGVYSFYVHDYTNRSSSNSTALSNSGAKVQLYVGSALYYTFNIPVGKGGTVWHVFDFDPSTDTITPVNQFSYSSNPDTLSIRSFAWISDENSDLSCFANLPEKSDDTPKEKIPEKKVEETVVSKSDLAE